MVLSSSIEVRDSPVAGKGLFCTKPIKAGDTIWTPDADEATKYYHTMAQIKSWSEEEQKHFMNNAYLVAPGTYSGAEAAGRCRSRRAGRRRGRCVLPRPSAPAPSNAGVRFGVESDKGEFMNHSCAPNVREFFSGRAAPARRARAHCNSAPPTSPLWQAPARHHR